MYRKITFCSLEYRISYVAFSDKFKIHDHESELRINNNFKNRILCKVIFDSIRKSLFPKWNLKT